MLTDYRLTGYTVVHAILLGGIPELESAIFAQYPEISDEDLTQVVAYHIGVTVGFLRPIVPDWEFDDYSDVLAELGERGYFRETNETDK